MLRVLVDILGRPQVHEAILVTAAEVIVAFIIAVPLGAAIGVLIAEYDYAGQIFKPLLFYVFSVPKSIFLPMFILIMGMLSGKPLWDSAFFSFLFGSLLFGGGGLAAATMQRRRARRQQRLIRRL